MTAKTSLISPDIGLVAAEATPRSSHGFWSLCAKTRLSNLAKETDVLVMMEGEYLRRTATHFMHYCQACDRVHPLPYKGWSYNNDPEQPSFSASFEHTLHDYYDGRIDGYVQSSGICHYTITAGKITYHSNSTHAFAGKTVDMVALPEYFRDNLM